MCGPIFESLISDECQDISGSLKHNIHQAVRAREGSRATKMGAAYSPSNLREKKNRVRLTVEIGEESKC